MTAQIALALCLAFIVGTFASIYPDWTSSATVFGVGIALGLFVPAIWRKRVPKRWIWFLAALVAALACTYAQFRTPQPQANDISRFATGAEVVVRGTVKESPSTTRSGRAKFILASEEVKLGENRSESVSGDVYATISLTQATGLVPGQVVRVSGRLYQPASPDHRSEFDFKKYLARSGIFAGLSGRSLELQGDSPTWGGWTIRSRMVRAHVSGAGVPEGVLLSSLVLGNRAVDLPNDLKDIFVDVGLACALAASGFQVSLILGTVLFLSRKSSPLQQFLRGTICLLGYLCLTGSAPSVARAVVMGFGGLIALVTQRRGRPLAWLALAAVILLIWQPMWIWDLGFQFSFLATFGLIATAEPIAKRLERIPPLFANTLAVLLAAYIWTLPLQLYTFGRISIYSIPANILTLPLVAIATIGGMLSGILGAIFEPLPLGSAVSWLMFAPLHFTIALAQWIHTLPGAVTNAGTIHLWQMLVAYAILFSIWVHPWIKKIWLPAIIVAIAIIFVPIAVERGNLFRVTLLATGQSPVMVVQQQGKTLLINSGDRQTATFTLLPFLQKAGLNQIDLAISTDPQLEVSEGWNTILANSITVQQFHDAGAGVASKEYAKMMQKLAAKGISMNALELNTPIEFTDRVKLQLIHQSPGILRLQTAETTWLLLADADEKVQRVLLDKSNAVSNLKADILWWDGGDIVPELLNAVQPTAAIASSPIVTDIVADTFARANIRLYWTGRDGAIEWTLENDIRSAKDSEDSKLKL
ncbi:ComEC/Rec2 family competence protein [Pseudanabaena sp. PCC 6802]|uniref:ComEC/Rec2 family competence protein n=1 Tax=Pseudanabaena sp. PCC 6802 TaxID=118173 RepID=UPI0003470757|nr:ComEC/Rec2 family competence protein [Pseudanabaena sp. PCC 6802]